MDDDAFIALGTEHGCEFSAEDLAENVGLSDEELDGVAGGAVCLAAFFKSNSTKYDEIADAGFSPHARR